MTADQLRPLPKNPSNPAPTRLPDRPYNGRVHSYLNAKFVKKLLAFSCEHLTELRREQTIIRNHSRAHYPLMKLVDMYFWQLGYEAGAQRKIERQVNGG